MNIMFRIFVTNTAENNIINFIQNIQMLKFEYYTFYCKNILIIRIILVDSFQ